MNIYKFISIMEIYFSVALITFFPGKVRNKGKVRTYRSYVSDFYKSHARAPKSRRKVENKLDLT